MKPRELKAAVNAIGSPLDWASISTVEDGLIVTNLELSIHIPCTVPPEAVGYTARKNVRTVKQILTLADYEAERIECKLIESTQEKYDYETKIKQEVLCFTLHLGAYGQAIEIEVTKGSVEMPDLAIAQIIDPPLAEALRAHVFASTDQSRTMHPVYFDKDRVVATDGHRITLIDAPIADDVNGLLLNMAAPKKLKLKDFYRFPNDSVFAANDTGSVIARVSVKGPYPAYKRVVPQWSNFEPVELNIAELTRACNLAKKVPHARGFAELKLTPSGYSTKNTEYPFDKPLDVNFKPFSLDARYVLDVLKDIGKGVETVTMYHEDDPKDAVTFVHGDAVYAIMPLQLTD